MCSITYCTTEKSKKYSTINIISIDTDVMFGGKTAFPKSSTIVTGLKYKKKYPGHMQENPWLSEQLKI